jgi:hypothetical protein
MIQSKYLKNEAKMMVLKNYMCTNALLLSCYALGKFYGILYRA